MSTLLAIDPGIASTGVKGNWLPDLGLLKTWVSANYGPVTRSLAYVTYQPLNMVGTLLDDLSDNGRDQYSLFLEKTGYTDVSRIYSTQGDNGSLKCNVDTSIVRDIWSHATRKERLYSPVMGYYDTLTKGPYNTFVGIMGDWDIIRPLLVSERVVGTQPTLMELGIKVVIIYKEECTKKEVLSLADRGVITFIPLEKYRDVLSKERAVEAIV
jgi:hypothetical protein